LDETENQNPFCRGRPGFHQGSLFGVQMSFQPLVDLSAAAARSELTRPPSVRVSAFVSFPVDIALPAMLASRFVGGFSGIPR